MHGENKMWKIQKKRDAYFLKKKIEVYSALNDPNHNLKTITTM